MNDYAAVMGPWLRVMYHSAASTPPLDPPGAESWCEQISGLADYHQPVITNPGGTDRTAWVGFI